MIEQPEGWAYWRHVAVHGLAISVLRKLVDQWIRDRCPQQAASLAFQTVLSVVPMVAVTLAAFRLWGDVGAESTLVEFVSNEFIPVSRAVIAEQLTEWSKNINIQSLGIVGLVGTVLLAFVMVNNLEKTINAIWRSEKKRSLPQKFVIFYATATLGPLLLGASLYEAAKAGLTKGFSGVLLSMLASFGALFLANLFLPAHRVRARAAAIGALVSTVLFEIAKYAFNAYVTGMAFSNFQGIYGALAVVPLWLIWIYYSWLVFLLGVEFTYAAQNLTFLLRRDRRERLSLENEIVQRVNGVVASRVMRAICSTYVRGSKVTPRQILEEMFDLSSDVLDRITKRLEEHDLIIEVEGDHRGYLPARPPSEICLADVLAAFRSDDVEQLTAQPQNRLDRVLADIDRDARERARDLKFDDLS